MKQIQIKYCDSLLSKAIGLMFSFKQKILVFRFKKESIRPLHMFFVFHSIDVLFLNSKKKIVERARLKPFAIYMPKKKAKYIVEMPKGTKFKKSIKI